jgi:hypothetical protein
MASASELKGVRVTRGNGEPQITQISQWMGPGASALVAAKLVENLSHVVDHEEVAFAREEASPAAGDSPGEVPPHGRRHEDVRFALPKKDRRRHFVRLEAPGSPEEHDVQSGAPMALAEGFGDDLGQHLTHLRAPHRLGIRT